MKRMVSAHRSKVFLVASVIAGCSLFEGSSAEKSGKVVPGTSGATGATGGSGATGGTNASGGAGGAPASGCVGFPGPTMVELGAANGVKFCIDRTEVTQSQYAQFLQAVQSKPGAEHTDCAQNGTYTPLTQPSSYEPATCIEGVVWTPEKTPDRPVVCVDWCDAFAYCAWAGKRLCGRIGGGRNGITGKPNDPIEPGNDASKSQWYAACTQGGTTTYPYGDTYDPLACEGYDSGGSMTDAGKVSPTWETKKDVGARAGCRGNGAPYSGIRDLSGSIAEFTDECFDTTSSPTILYCAARGGGFGSGEAGLACRITAAQSLEMTGPHLGFRCCKDLP